MPADGVIGTDPAAGAKAPRDSTLQLLVSDGPAPVAVPDVSKAASFDAAAATLTGLGFTVTRADDFNATIAAGGIGMIRPPAPRRRGSAVRCT